MTPPPPLTTTRPGAATCTAQTDGNGRVTARFGPRTFLPTCGENDFADRPTKTTRDETATHVMTPPRARPATIVAVVAAVVLCRSPARSLDDVDANAVVRGVPADNAKLYTPGKDFLCLDGSFSIPYSFINDDYCDCLDASDEPGTSACPNGTFYCTNTGYLPLIIPSSRVNDGICDCCDGSDEWSNESIKIQKGPCQNICEKLGLAAKIEADRIENLYALGFKIREQLITKGNYLLSQKHIKLLHLLSTKEDAQLIRSNLFFGKEIAEKKEKNALKLEKLKQLDEAFKIFNEIDINKNKKIEVEEVIAYSTFDQDKNGIVSPDEINDFMEDKKELDIKDFMSIGWNRIKMLIFTKSVGINNHPIIVNSKEKNSDDNVYEKKREYNLDDESIKINEFFYSEKTKIIINEAEKARELFGKADTRFEEIQRNIFDIQKSVGKNFGPDNEFAALDEQCYELIDREHTYKLCLFEKVTQIPTNGGDEVNLGIWNGWTHFINNETKYHTMLYDKGDSCMNHHRMTYVHLICGLEPKLLSVSEPSHCEFLMQFQLPSVCVLLDTKYSREFSREEL